MASPAIDYAALAKQAGAFKSISPPAAPSTSLAPATDAAPAAVDYAALAKDAGAVSSTPAPAADFRTTNEKDATGAAAVDPNTLGTAVSHTITQINPITAVQTIAKALTPEVAARALNKGDQAVFGSKPLSDADASTYGPLNTLSHIGAAQGALFDKAKAAYHDGDYLTAARHFVDYLIPIVGPAIDKSSDLLQAGHWAAGGGDALGIALSLFGPKAIASARLQTPALLKNPNAEDVAAVQAGAAAGVPIDAATATGNRFVRGAQKLADESLGGSVVAQKADATTQAAMGQYGESLADQARGASVTPEQAGQSIRHALASKVQAHADLADHAYDQLRTLEEQSRKPIGQRIDDLSAKRLNMPADLSNNLNVLADEKRWQAAVTTEGSKVTTPDGTEGTVVTPAKDPVNGGRVLVRHDLDGQSVERSYRATELDASGPQTTMGLPVDTRAAKAALKPLYDQMRRQMPLTQRDASPGLQALQNILDGPDVAPLSQVDRDLSVIKGIARSQGGLAKMATSKLEAAVQAAATKGGPEVLRALKQGRQATIAKVGTEALVDALPGGKLEEPLAVFNRATAPKDAGIELLRGVSEHVPQALPQIARAKLEDLMAMGPDKSFAEWSKLGPETKRILFPQTGQTQQLQQFFTLAKRLATNPNPSGSALTLWKGGELTALVTNPTYGIPYSIGATTLSAILHSPTVARALTKGMSISLSKAAPAAQAAAVADLVKAAQAAEIPLATLPKAADRSPSGATP